MHTIIDDVKAGKYAIKKSLIKTFPCKSCDDGKLVKKQARKTKKTFWVCLGCDSFYTDHYGKPKDKIEPIKKVECPTCKEVSVGRYPSKAVTGVYSWFCTNKKCGKSYQDIDGKLDDKQHPCKSCKTDMIKLYSKKNKRPFWLCTNKDECGEILPDKDFAPNYDYQPPKISEHKCLSCQGGLIFRAGKEGRSGFWGCSNWNKKGVECKVTYEDKDGKPVLELKEVHNCPKCKGILSKRSGSKGDFWSCSNWNKKPKPCKASFDDLDGKPKLS